MENIVTRPVNMVKLGNQSPGFAFCENDSVYMLTEMRVVNSGGYEELQAVRMANGEMCGFMESEYVEPVDTFTVHAKPSLARSERVVKG